MVAILSLEGIAGTCLSEVGMVVSILAIVLALVLDLPGSAKLRTLFFSFVQWTTKGDKAPTTSENTSAPKSSPGETKFATGGRVSPPEDVRIDADLEDKDLRMASEDTDTPQQEVPLSPRQVHPNTQVESHRSLESTSTSEQKFAIAEIVDVAGKDAGLEESRPKLASQIWLDSGNSNDANTHKDRGVLDDTEAMEDRCGELRNPLGSSDLTCETYIGDDRPSAAVLPDSALVSPVQAPPIPQRLLSSLSSFGLPRAKEEVVVGSIGSTIAADTIETAAHEDISESIVEHIDTTLEEPPAPVDEIASLDRSGETEPTRSRLPAPTAPVTKDIGHDARKKMIQAAKEATRVAKLRATQKEFTTVSISGVPTSMTSQTLRQHLDSVGLRNIYDYIYMPQDLVTGLHTGRAYVNFVDQKCAETAQTILSSSLPSNMEFSLMEAAFKNRNEARGVGASCETNKKFSGLWSADDGGEDLSQGSFQPQYDIPQPIAPRPQSRNGSENFAMPFGDQFQQGWPQEDVDGVEKFSPQIREQFRKTKPCKFFKNNRCALGVNCTYAHSQEELTSVPDLTKTRLCYSFFRGHCNDTKCKYAHGYQELRSTNTIYKTEFCRWFNVGGCKAGNACRYAHDYRELRSCENEVGFSSDQLQFVEAESSHLRTAQQQYSTSEYESQEEDESALFEQLLGKDLFLACGTEEADLSDMVLQ